MAAATPQQQQQQQQLLLQRPPRGWTEHFDPREWSPTDCKAMLVRDVLDHLATPNGESLLFNNVFWGAGNSRLVACLDYTLVLLGMPNSAIKEAVEANPQAALSCLSIAVTHVRARFCRAPPPTATVCAFTCALAVLAVLPACAAPARRGPGQDARDLWLRRGGRLHLRRARAAGQRGGCPAAHPPAALQLHRCAPNNHLADI